MKHLSLPTAFFGSAILLCALGAQARISAQDHVNIQPRTALVAPARKETSQKPAREKATARYPVVTGLTNPAVLRRVQQTLSFKNASGSTLAELRQEEGFEGFDYTVNYNKNYLLDITFQYSGMGAYPSTTTKHFLINLKNGMVVKAADAFKAEALPKLADRANQKLKAEVKEQVKVVNEDKEQNAEQKASLKEQLEQLTFTVENLNEFSVSEQGVTFLFDAGFPHVIQALQPAGEYFFTYRALGSFVKPNGPLAIFK